jgi:hypothetical protein
VADDPFQQMIEDLYGSELAQAGRYYPADGTQPFDIRVIRRAPTELALGFETQAAIDRLRLSVRQSEVAAPQRGDTLTRIEPAGETFYDILAVTADEQRLEWFLTVNERD